ncbi:unnamed protein product, partial [Mesorhabditis belari]|uniref:Ig-like domain-containing protein n=1 Tax=Mesorhabditis belari TaxID=2138241 RepID=A0AAF3FIM8_9BILA
MGPSTVVLSVLLIALTPHLGDALPNPTMVPPGTSSLTFVFDITGSMFDDLEQVRAGAKKIYETVLTQRQRLIYNYVLVPFHDPDLGEIIDTTDALYFQRQLGKVHVYGGGDCPEMTLTGIKKALEISLPSSFIYVFTDARSKDYHLEDQVINLIQEKQSSVVFVMTGDCGNRTHPGFRTYEKIAAASFGQVFHLQKSDVSAVLEYVRHAVQQKKVHLSYEVRDRGGSTVRQIPVDKHMTELTLSLSGDKDDEDFLDISIKDPKGNVIDRNAYSKEGGTIDLKNVKLIRLKDPMPGNWQVTTNSRLKHTLRVFGHGTIDFKYGFGAKPLETIELTRPRPVDGQTTYLMANMTGLIPPGTPVEISLIDYYGHPLYTHPASPSKTNPYLYFVGPFVPPKGLFFVQVKGVDDQDYEFQRIAPTAIGSVSVGGPRAYMAQITTAFINKPVNLSCVVESTAPYSLRWKHGDQYLGPPLFYSESDTSTWTINEVTQKERGDYSCEVSSAHGNHTARTYLETREPPPHIFNMRNASVTVGQPAYFHCQTQSASKAEIRWLRHGQQIGRTPNTMVFQNGTLVIWRASRADIGGYECQARNGGGLSTQNVFLSVYERPTIFVNPSSLDFVAGKRFNLSCRASGDPHPEHYIAPNNDLIINNPTSQSAGVYECRAQNTAGSASGYSDVREARPPKIQLKNSKEMVSRGEYVELQCLVLEGSPQPKIKWFKHNRELLYPLHENMVLSDSYLRIRNVQDTDTGQYSCVAENMAGREVAQTRIQVGSQPSIVPAPDTVRVNIERQVTLPCRAVGQPAPVIVWSKNGVLLHELDNPRYKQLDDGSLLITGADLEDQDTFTCTAKNEYGESQKSINVIITGLVAPVLGHVPPEEQLIEGHDLRLSCVVVLGTPRPILQWYKNGLPVVPTRSIIIEGAGSGLLLRNGNPKDEGQYKCVASSPAGNATLNINVSMIKRPTVKHPNATEEEYGDEHVETEPIKATEGETIDLPCRIDGRPKPTITWMLDGRGITADNKDYTILEDNTLRIHKTDRTTTGRFVCTAVNAAGEAEQVTQLSVVAPPLITPGNTNYNLIEGHPIVIPCDVHGEPQPEIQWFLNDELVTDGWVDEDGSLHIETANVFKGNLKCVAVNEAGRDEMTVSVTVHTIPKIFGSEQQQVVEASVNTTLLMPCPAEGHPVPKRVWSYDNLPILDGDEFYGTTAHILEDGSLSLDNVDFDHLGRFECKVSNVAGEDTLVYNLKVNQPPKIVSDTPGTIDVIQGLTLEIACKAVGRPNPTITWEKDGFQVIPSSVVTVDHSGTLRIHNARVDNAGLYRCTASNPAGSDTRDTKVIIQEPPTITGDTPDNYTAVAGDKVEMRCQVTGNPQPKIEWHKKGVPVIDDDHIRVTEDGTLVIEEAQAGDESFYTCKVSNAAGMTEKLVRLKVTTIPEIPDSHIVQTEVVRLNNPFSLYCPVFSTPLPTITWELSDGPLAEMDPNIQLSDDRRRLHVEKARITDAGVYKCIARNDAGSSSKSFDVEVVVPINIDESKWKRKMSVLEGGRVEIGCPVSGLPAPEINWIVEGRIMSRESSEFQGVRLSEDGQTLIIDSATADHTGQYHCVAQNKAGSLDVDVDLNVLIIKGKNSSPGRG